MELLVLLAQMLRIAVPYLLAASGGVMSERAGLVALTLEGYMLAGAFAAALGSHYGGSPWLGVLAGVAAGVAMAMVYGVATIRFRADQVVVGIAINLLAIGLTRFFLRLAFDSSSNSPRVSGFGDTAAAGSAATSSGIAEALTNPVVLLGLLAVPLTAVVLYRTPFGLRVRAVGEHPQAAVTLGVPVERVRYLAVAVAGALAGLGGTYLALDQHQFTDSMTAGRGFIALAAVIFGRWDPVRVAGACLVFATAETAMIKLQGVSGIPSQFVEMLPYLLTIIALAGLVGRAKAPAALGRVDE